MVKKCLLGLGLFLGVLVLLACAGLLYLSVTEYRPQELQIADLQALGAGEEAPGTLTVTTWNIGYAGLGEESDFFMDGGAMVAPPSPETVKKNMAGIESYLLENPSDIWLFQEVDIRSARTGQTDQFLWLNDILSVSSAFAYNYKCPFVPIPLPPLGRVESGVALFSRLQPTAAAQRISLPCPHVWPLRTANMKRCLLVSRWKLADSDRELVVIDLHLEAYESGEGRIAQTKRLLELMQEEYAAGNYVIAGGDFNQSFPDALEVYPILDPEKWTPGLLAQEDLPEGWQYVFDVTAPTCRLLDQPLHDQSQLFVIDGFLLSPNLRVEEVQTVDLGFAFSDHNPVRLTVTLEP